MPSILLPLKTASERLAAQHREWKTADRDRLPQGEPTRTLDAITLPGHLRGHGGVQGFNDVAFVGAGQYAIAAACRNGQVPV